jgi:hypothetical protein
MSNTITVRTIFNFFEKHKKIIATQYHFVIRLQQESGCHSYNKVIATTIDSALPLNNLVSINNLPVIKYFIFQSYNNELASTVKSGLPLNNLNVIASIKCCMGSNHYNKPLKSKDGIRAEINLNGG